MPRRRLVSHRLVAVFLLGCIVFNYPLLAVFDRAGTMGGFPASFAWLMASWLGLIGLLAMIVERSDSQDH